VAAYLLHQGVEAVNMEDIGAPTRLLQYVRFAQAGIPVPAARYLPPRLLEDSYPDLADQLGLPFILTALRGGGGRQDFLVVDGSSFAARLHADGQARAVFLAREFIPADDSHHLLVMGGQVRIVVRKPLRLDLTSPPDDSAEKHAALIDPVTFDPCAQRLAIQAASLMGCDVADTEIARHCATGEWYVLNTKTSPAISGGDFGAEKLGAYTAYLERKLRATRERIKSPGERRPSPGHLTQTDLDQLLTGRRHPPPQVGGEL
jgi:glutathione synthase/RimK-type ligase-like ATP-grasp enzyme